ncbi:hypothetical protein FB567DRAFT_550874 [Paraphoma chrysanthemicola]|uniref:Uncharacterized protein n=1 Tax=Paraphoma chrysanthemicola TaxID=798071 RepID=A0A8K0R321_9PLEO|nr:hypothetical protein FB567DRAFT_550874 [Paraphoma chrysanthemicola]
MSTTSHQTSTLPSRTTNMAGRGQYDEFAIRYYDQGSPITSQHRSPTQRPSAVCPYHTVILDNRTPRPAQTSAQTTSHQTFLERMPPACLTARWQVGTSTSSGCTCAQNLSRYTDDFAREVDAAIHPSQSANSQTAHTGRT